MNFCVPYQSKVLTPNVLAMKVKKSGRESRVDRTIVRQSGEASQMKDILLLLLLRREREDHLIRNLVTSSRVCVGAHKNREQKKNREHGGTSAARRSFYMCTQI